MTKTVLGAIGRRGVYDLPGLERVSEQSMGARGTQSGIIEIEFATGHRLSADASVAIGVLRVLVEALVGRWFLHCLVQVSL
jgi:hypothetical protein